MRTCVVCEVGIEHRNDDALTCSKVCRWRMQRIRRKNKRISCSAGTSKSCEGCESIIRDRAPQARFCSDLCRQETANRNARQARLLDKPDRNCQWCNGPMAASMKITASYCGPVCRKAAEKKRHRDKIAQYRLRFPDRYRAHRDKENRKRIEQRAALRLLDNIELEGSALL